MENESTQDFLPTYGPARVAVERARQIVKENKEMISRLKLDSNIEDYSDESDPFVDTENFSANETYGFDLHKIKSSNEVKDFFKNIFGVH
jgi:hypothetical protein